MAGANQLPRALIKRHPTTKGGSVYKQKKLVDLRLATGMQRVHHRQQLACYRQP